MEMEGGKTVGLAEEPIVIIPTTQAPSVPFSISIRPESSAATSAWGAGEKVGAPGGNGLVDAVRVNGGQTDVDGGPPDADAQLTQAAVDATVFLKKANGSHSLLFLYILHVFLHGYFHFPR